MNRNGRFLTLVRREFWEHRSLWLTPLAAVGLMFIAVLFAPTAGNGIDVTVDVQQQSFGSRVTEAGAIAQLGIVSFIGLFAGIVVVIYLLDCLFAERRDRSILFWKSLPVSDAEAVLTKLTVGLVLIPLFVLMLSMVLQPLLAGVVALRFPVFRPFFGQLVVGGIAAMPKLLGMGIAALLWYAPLAAYLMLASVLARRAPVMYAVLPVVALGVTERLLFGSKQVFHFVGERLFPVPQQSPVNYDGGNGWAMLSNQWWKLFSEPALWLGLIAAAAMLYAVIRLRRYRDDT